MKNNAVHLMTPPQREAVTELARAYALYTTVMLYHRGDLPEASERLLAAQDALGIQLVPTRALRLGINKDAAA